MGRPRYVVLAAACCLLLGALVGWLGSADRTAQQTYLGTTARNCPVGPKVDELRLVLAMDGAATRSAVRESAEVVLSDVPEGWLAEAGANLPLCLFANGATFGTGETAYLSSPTQLPLAGYDLTGDHLTVRFASTELSGARAIERDLDQVDAATVIRNGRHRLSIDLHPCRSPAGRLACGAAVPSRIELHVANDQLRPPSPAAVPQPVSVSLVTGTAPPASIRNDAANAATVFTWRLDSTSDPLTVSVPTTARLSDVSLRRSTWGPVSVSWGYFATKLSVLLPLVAAGILLTRGLHRKISRRARGLLLAFVALALGTSLYFYEVDEFVTAAVWTLVTFAIGDVRRKTLRAGAVIGLLLAAVGTYEYLPILISTGLVVTTLTGTTAAVTQLRRSFLLLPRPGLRIRFWGLGDRLSSLARKLQSGAGVALVLAVALLVGDNIAIAAISAADHRSILDGLGDRAGELIASSTTSAVRDVTYVLLNSWAIFLLALVAQMLDDGAPGAPGVSPQQRLAPTHAEVLAITLVL